MKLPKEAEYIAATGFTLNPANAFRSGLGTYKGQALFRNRHLGEIDFWIVRENIEGEKRAAA